MLDLFSFFFQHIYYVFYYNLIYDLDNVDGVFYPGVTDRIPKSIREEVEDKLSNIKGSPVRINALFLRESKAGVGAPTQAHTDDSIGRYSFMLYLNRQEDCRGGTSFLPHKASGLNINPQDEDFLDQWRMDANNAEEWKIEHLCEMAPNKACIFDSQVFHRAEPIGGFGEGTSVRLVMTAFYD